MAKKIASIQDRCSAILVKVASKQATENTKKQPGLGSSVGWLLGGGTATDLAVAVPRRAYMKKVLVPTLFRPMTGESVRAWETLAAHAKGQGVDVMSNDAVADTVRSASKGSKGVRKYLLDLNANMLGSSPAYYVPAKPAMGLHKPTIGYGFGVSSPGVLAHEIGHHLGGKALIRGNMIGRPSLSLGTSVALFSKDKDTSRKAAIAGTAGAVPMLVSEVDASRRGWQLMRRLGLKGGRDAFVGVPTYVMAASAPLLAHYGKKALGGFGGKGKT